MLHQLESIIASISDIVWPIFLPFILIVGAFTSIRSIGMIQKQAKSPSELKIKNIIGPASISLGAMIGMNPVIALSCFGVFLIIVAITKYVSLGSVVGISISPIIMLVLNKPKGVLVTLFLTASVIYTHRENIKRLLNGTERKIGSKK